MSLHGYSENNLNFRPESLLQKLDTVKEGILLELVLNIRHLGLLEEKFVLRMTHSRIPDFKDLSTVTTVIEQQGMQALG